MRKAFLLFWLLSLLNTASAETAADIYTLDQVIQYGLEHNPGLRSAKADVDMEMAGITAARAEMMPRLDISAGVTKYHYPTATEPLYGAPPNTHFPSAFYTTIYDADVSLSLPLYRGGRLSRALSIAELRKSAAAHLYSMNRNDLVFNLTSIYYKILQIEKIVEANEEQVKRLEAHRRDVELLLQAGTAAKVDLLRAETELAHARQTALISRNSRESAYELLKSLMGMDDTGRTIRLAPAQTEPEPPPSLAVSIDSALSRRPDYLAASKRLRITEERVRLAEGRRYPSLNLAGDYSEKAGPDAEWKENWFVGLRLSMPIFEGGAISADIARARAELMKAREEERALRLAVMREVRDAYLNYESASERISVAQKALESAKEGARIEGVRYRAGVGTSTDLIDAQTALLRAETEYYQALYDKAIARAALRRAVGDDTVELDEKR